MAKVPITWGGINPRTGQPFRWGDPELTWNGFIETSDPHTSMQDLIDLSPVTTDDWTAVDAALDVIQEKLVNRLVNLSVEQRSDIQKMGPKSEAFCRQALITGRANVTKLDPETAAALPKAEGDLGDLDKLNPRFTRLKQMFEKADDSMMALGSDVMVFATFLYGLLKALGASSAGLDTLRKQLGARFAKSTPKKPDGGSGGSGGGTGGTP